jgi:cytoskeletal protein RodZ
MRDQIRASSPDRANADVIVTATVTAMDPAVASQHKRRTLFFCLLGAILLPALVAAVLPNAQAEDTVFVAAASNDSTTASQAVTTATRPSTTITAPSTSPPHVTSTTAKPQATTTTTAKPKATTTTTTVPKAIAKAAPAPAAVAAPQPAPPAVAPPAGSGATAAEASFLACVRQRESGGNYSVVSSNGMWFGAYQMTRSTWDSAARQAGRSDLVGVPPNQASPADQDYLALVLYRWLGKSPWGGAC